MLPLGQWTFGTGQASLLIGQRRHEPFILFFYADDFRERKRDTYLIERNLE